MAPARSLILCLALGAPACLAGVLIAPVTALAADAMFLNPGLIQVLPVGDVVGGEQVQMYFYALGTDGSPMPDLKPKATASKGSASDPESIGGGLYRFTFTAPTVDGATDIEVKVKGKTEDKSAFEVGQIVSVRPVAAGNLQMTANPPELVLGQGSDATLSFTLAGTGQPGSAADLVASTTSGEVVNITDMGGGRFTARFVPPAVNYPHLAVITVADRRDPGAIFGTLTIPLLGKVDYPVTAAAGANVVLRIEDREFGPVQAGADGKAAVPITAPPGVAVATQITASGGTSNQEQIDLRVPDTNRLRLVPTWVGVPADESLQVPVRVVVVSPTGQPDANANVQLSVEGGGKVTPAIHEGNGVYRGTFFPPATPGEVKITAKLGDSSVHLDTVAVNVIPARPTDLKLSSEPATLPASGGSFKVFSKLTGAAGAGLGDRDLVHFVTGADLVTTKDLANGDYQAELRSSSAGVSVLTAVRQTPTGNPLRHLVLLPGPSRVTNDGASSAGLMLMTVDALGYPVPDTEVALAVEAGDGKVPTTIRTDAHGMAQVVYTAGTAPTMIKVRARSAGLSAAAAFVQAPPGVDVPVLPLGGTPAKLAANDAWSRITRSITLGDAASGAPVAAAPAATTNTRPAGNVSVVNVAISPAQVEPGTTVTIKVDARDAAGIGVSGQTLNVAVPVGMPGAILDLGQGLYEVTYDVPKDFAGGQVTVFAGGVMGTTPIEVAAAGKVAKVKEPKAPKAPTEAGDYPWLRVGAGYVASSYRYEQRPITSNGPLLTDVLAIGGDAEGAKNATPHGFEVGAKGWLPMLTYVGFDAHYRMTFYGITTEAFAGQVAPDQLYDINLLATARYPFQAGEAQFHIGARAGFTFDDFILFKGDIDAGSVEYETLAVPGLGLGGEIGTEVAGFFMVAGVTESLAYFASPYAFDVDVTAGYGVLDNMFLSAGFESQTRNLMVVGADSGTEYGELSDGQLLFKIGLGVQL